MTFPAILEEINFSFGSQSSPIIADILDLNDASDWFEM